MERSGSLEGVLDTRQPGGRNDSPGALPGELLGQTRCTVELPLLVASMEESLEFLASELLGVAGARRACNVSRRVELRVAPNKIRERRQRRAHPSRPSRP